MSHSAVSPLRKIESQMSAVKKDVHLHLLRPDKNVSLLRQKSRYLLIINLLRMPVHIQGWDVKARFAERPQERLFNARPPRPCLPLNAAPSIYSAAAITKWSD